MTKNEPHNFTVGSLGDLLRPLLPADVFLREEKSAGGGRFWQPEPDLAVVRGRRAEWRNAARPPSLVDFLLAIEVADTTYRKDRLVKWLRYAAAGVPVYWIVHLKRRHVEVYTDPTGRGKQAAYANCVIVPEGSDVPVVIDGVEVGRIATGDFLP